MKPLLSLCCAALLIMSGGLRAEDPVLKETDVHDRETEAKLPAIDLTGQLLYRFLLAEIAGQRGQLGISAEMYLEIARETRDPRILRRAADIALHGRRPGIAYEVAKLWREVEPKSHRPHQMMVGLLATQGRPSGELQAAVAAFLASDSSSTGGSLMQLNRLLARSADRKAAQALVEEVTKPYLSLPEAHFARAQAAYEADDAATARQAMRRALEIKPDWEQAVVFLAQLAGSRTDALAEYESFLRAYPGAREARLAYARTLVREKRYEEGRHQFQQLLAQGADDPEKNGDVIFAVAVLSMQLNDTQDAEMHLHRLIEVGHAEADKARYYLGQIAEEAKRWEDALRWFELVGHGEHYLNARLHAANVLAKQGKIEAARRHLVETDATTTTERAQLLVGEAQLLREAGRLADAHAVLESGLKRLPDQPELLYEIALVAEKMGRMAELEFRLRRLLEIRPDHAHALNALGFSLADRNERLPEARKLIERALELAPDDPFILDSKGWVMFRQGEAQAALETLKRAFGLRADPEIAAHIGEVLWALGRRDEARATWENARREHPANEVLVDTIKRFQP